MVLESTVVCVDNSEFMRNGDFLPTRLQAQQDAAGIVCQSKTRSNPENNVGLLTLATNEVLLTLTSDVGRLLSKLCTVQPNGDLKFLSGIRIAHLVLKHRQGKNHKMRIVAFVGSPIDTDEKELIKLAKRLKKEKVNVDIVNFGEHDANTEKLTAFINTLNGKDGTGSHLVTVPPGPHLSDALISSPVIQGEDGSGAIPSGGFEFGVDPNEDPELALALRVSMEEQRARQEREAAQAASDGGAPSTAGGATAAADSQPPASSDEAMLEKALAMSLQSGGATEERSAATPAGSAAAAAPPNLAAMTEEEQIAYAMQMSLQQAAQQSEEPMETDAPKPSPKKEGGSSDECSEMMQDPSFVQYVLENLPGVDPGSEAIKKAMEEFQKKKKTDEKKEGSK